MELKASAQQGVPVTPSGIPQTFEPQPTIPAGMFEDAEGAGAPLSLFLSLLVLLLLLPESLPHATGERLANNVATASPRITFAFFIGLSCPSRCSVFVRNARLRAIESLPARSGFGAAYN